MREYIVDSGAGLHIVDQSVFTNEELLAKGRLKKSIWLQTANGRVVANQYVK